LLLAFRGIGSFADSLDVSASSQKNFIAVILYILADLGKDTQTQIVE
jgi:hypothetical protein